MLHDYSYSYALGTRAEHWGRLLGLIMVLGNGAGTVPGKLLRIVPEHTGAIAHLQFGSA
jgi:hypothetical protein